MELIWTAFFLGLVGSLHCAAMCGPLLLAMPAAGPSRLSFTTSRIVYNLGRIATYAAIGVVFGAVGKTFALAGLQRWLSILAGAAILCGLLLSSRFAMNTPVARLVGRLKSLFGRLLRQRTVAAQFALGAINGLLPCGLVYIAAAGAATSGDLWGGAVYMAAFGVGTLPMMFGLGLAGSRLQFALRFRKLIPISVVVVAALLVLRGMSLGIPYLSPDISTTHASSCH